MKLRGVLALVLALICAPALAQVNQGTSPLTGAKGGTNNAFMQFTGPAASLKTYTLPNVNATLAALGVIQTWTSAQSFSDGTLILLGSSSGSSTIKAPATGGGTATLFPGSDTIAGIAANQALTNKTINCASNTCTVRIGSDVSGLGAGVATALGVNVGSAGAFVTFNGALGTPSSATLTNATGLPANGGLTGQTPVANGGTGQATATAARGSSGLNIDQATSTGDANYTIQAGDRMVYHTALTAARTDTLPAANSVNAGQHFYITDFRGVASASNTVTLLRAGADTINGVTSVVAINAQYGAGIFWSDGVSRWTFQPTSAGGGGTVSNVACNGVTITTSGTCPSAFFPTNCTLAASVASNLLTVALKDNTGADATATSPCYIPFRSATATTGSTTFDTVTSALSISTFATGATLGSSNSTAFRIWVVAFDNGGSVVLGLINCSVAGQIFPLNEGAVATSVAISGSATSAGVFYTPNGTTLTGKAFRILGYVEYNASGLATAGTYATAPNFVQTFGPGIRKPGEVVQWVMPDSVAGGGTTTTLIPFDNTIPQITEGTEFMNQAITPTSAANILQVDTGAFSSGSVAAHQMMALFQDATANALSATASFQSTSGATIGTVLSKKLLAGTTSSTTFRVRMGLDRAGTFTFGGSGGAAIFGGVGNNYLRVQEIMG